MRHEDIIETSSAYWNVLQWIFSHCLFLTEIPLVLYLFFKKSTYTLSILLPTSNAAFWKNLI